MPAYLLAEIDIQDTDRYQEYVRQVPATIEAYGGRYLARGGRAEVLEGSRGTHRVVLLEFDSYERAKEWYDSEIYRGPRELRQAAAVTQLLLIDGIDT